MPDSSNINTGKISEPQKCGECGLPLPQNALGGCCPRCLMQLGDASTQIENDGEKGTWDGLPEGLVTFGKYELFGRIGEGGMGVVYKARQADLDRFVAVKLLRSGLLASEQELKRFRTEAKSAAQLQHPGVVAIHEVGQEGGRHFFAMEYVEGKSLSDVVQRTPLAPGRAAAYVKQIAEVVEYAHQRDILHRDLKPANVLLDLEDRIRITDFGLAKHLNLESEMTIPGAIMGTPSYMPPEQAAGRQDRVSRASDVYSIGAILYDLLTGRPPFRADTSLETLRQVLEREPAPPRLLNAKVPKDLETICLKCLAKDPDRRYPTARELADDLNRFLKGEPIRARPISLPARAWRWCRRYPDLALVTALAIVSTAALFLLASFSRSEIKTHNRNLSQKHAPEAKDDWSRWSTNVLALAKRPDIRMMFREGDTNALQKAFTNQNLLPDRLGTDAQNWVAMDMKGKTLARYPISTNFQKIDRWERDYFKGGYALTKSNEVYYSKVYRSIEDGLYKVGLTAKIWESDDETAQPLGLITLMINSGSAQNRRIPLYAGQQIVLFAPADPNDPELGRGQLEKNYYAFLHPRLKNGEKVVGPVPLASLKRGWYLENVHSDNFLETLLKSPRLVGVTNLPPPMSDYYLVVQSSDWVGMWALGLGTAMAGLALAWGIRTVIQRRAICQDTVVDYR